MTVERSEGCLQVKKVQERGKGIPCGMGAPEQEGGPVGWYRENKAERLGAQQGQWKDFHFQF